MQHKLMVLLATFVLLSLLIAPDGVAKAQADTQSTVLDCPHYEPSLLKDKAFLHSLPLECLQRYKEVTRQAHPAANVQNIQPMAVGGPDGFGYTNDDSVSYSWISATTNSGLIGDDEFTGPINMGFNFPFYGIPQSQLYFSTNGLITFGAGSREYQSSDIPTDMNPNNLIATFWDDLHPQPDADRNMSTRFAQLAGLDGGGASEGTLIAPLLTIPITGARTVPNFSLADYRDAVELERKPIEIRRKRVEQGAVTIEMFNEAVAATNGNFFRTLRDDVEGASRALTELTDAVRDKEKAHTAGGGTAFVTPTSKIREVLDECLRLCRSWTKDGEHRDSADDANVAERAPEFPRPVDVKEAVTGPPCGGDVQTRQEALQTLLTVAEYFRRAEPHSPVSYALEQVVKWGRMSLPELLSELIADRSARDETFRRAGIPQLKDE